MAPLNPIGSWLDRGIGEGKQPRARWFFVCEGIATEAMYIDALLSLLDALKLPLSTEGVYLERTGEDESASNPKKLLEHAEGVRKGEIKQGRGKNGETVEYDFNEETDKIVIVFDADIYKDDEDGYQDYLDDVLDKGHIPAVTYPSFALYLLLHRENAYEDLVAPNEAEILGNKRVSSHYRYVERLFSDSYGINAKTGSGIPSLANLHEVAQAEEKHLNNDPKAAIGQLTSNIGVVIERFKNAG